MTELIIGARRPETLEKIELAIADHALVSIAAIRGDSRSRDFVPARHLIWGIAHKDLGLSYSQIARLYDRDHTTIMNGVQRAVESGNLPAARKVVNERFPGLLKGV